MKPEREIGVVLKRLGLSLAVAESCTGGLISHRITNVPGSSNYFERGFVVYSNFSKTELLGVGQRTLERHGAVSKEVARQMALGARRAAGTDFATGVTGIAGPVSDESHKPVGLVYVAVCGPDGPVWVRKHHFKGTRLQIKKQSAHAALSLLLHLLGHWERTKTPGRQRRPQKGDSVGRRQTG
ncbi:MAG: CinA family protein [Candidatus Abyssobacteria bacterium SURF_17]|uniref:CinA family protein n=1 Tax=Candidatus Abyssobacteria bacterium SURF_17 TaxID=2093361 RepID=A0A419F1U3_9BACT|nr:MAG: CinA family protein [Candidatus Abyssubacteria bacterium SURF_17]